MTHDVPLRCGLCDAALNEQTDPGTLVDQVWLCAICLEATRESPPSAETPA